MIEEYIRIVFNRYLEQNFLELINRPINDKFLKEYVSEKFKYALTEQQVESFCKLNSQTKRMVAEQVAKALDAFDYNSYTEFVKERHNNTFVIVMDNPTIQYFKKDNELMDIVRKNPALREQYDKIIKELFKDPFVFKKCRMCSDKEVEAREKEDIGENEVNSIYQYKTEAEAIANEPDVYYKFVKAHIKRTLRRFKIGQGDHRKNDTIYSIRVSNEKSNNGNYVDTIKLQEASNIDDTIIDEHIRSGAPIIQRLTEYSAEHFNDISIISIYKSIINYRIEKSQNLKPGDMKFMKYMEYLKQGKDIIFYDIRGRRIVPKIIDDYEEEQVYKVIEEVFNTMQFDASIRNYDELTMLLKLFEITKARYGYLSEKFNNELILSFTSRFFRGKISSETANYQYINSICSNIKENKNYIGTMQQMLAMLTISNYKVLNVTSINRLNIALQFINLNRIAYDLAISKIFGTYPNIGIDKFADKLSKVKKYTTLNEYAIEHVMELVPQEYDIHYTELCVLVKKLYTFKNMDHIEFDYDKFKNDLILLGVNYIPKEIELNDKSNILHYGELPVVMSINRFMKEDIIRECIPQKKIADDLLKGGYNAVVATSKNEFIVINTEKRLNNRIFVFKFYKGEMKCSVERLTQIY